MHMKRVSMAFAAVLSMSVSHVMASTVTGPYISGGAGYDITQSQHGHFQPGSQADGFGGSGSGAGQFRHKDGYTGYASFGWGFGNGLRAEVEGDYFYSQINHLNRVAAKNQTGGGDRNYGGFVNVLYDIDLKRNFGIDVPVTPYVGVGAGYLWSAMDDVNTNYANGTHTRWSGDKGGFAYQGIVGVAYDIPDVPGLALTADYRFIGQNAFGNGAYHSQTGSHSGNVDFDQRFNHQFTLNVRYAFNTAPPAPAPAPAVVPPAPEPARTYLVFFEWDSTALSQRVRGIISDAANASKHVSVTRIDVSGHADNTSIHGGKRGEAYNMKLSLKRAEAVKAELIRDGVDSGLITVRGFGDERPLVVTAPNTREAENRRVEIVLR